MQDFLKEYPTSKFYQEINQLVVTSYLHQRDFKGALEYLAKKKSSENNKFTKDVSYYRGVQLFNLKKLQEAYPYFLTASKSSDTTIKVSALYWKAETDFQLNNYKKSLEGFISFKNTLGASRINEFKSIDYNVAYCYFKLKEYENAANAFNNFIKKIDAKNALFDDANIRLADCYFVTKKYTNAILAYDKLHNRHQHHYY